MTPYSFPGKNPAGSVVPQPRARVRRIRLLLLGPLVLDPRVHQLLVDPLQRLQDLGELTIEILEHLVERQRGITLPPRQNLLLLTLQTTLQTLDRRSRVIDLLRRLSHSGPILRRP